MFLVDAGADDGCAKIDPSYDRFRDLTRFWIQRVAVPLLMVIGLFGNSITMIIMTRRRMRSTTNMYLAALAFVDMLYLVLTFLLGLSHYPNMAARKYYVYWKMKPFLMMLTDACSNTSVWLTVTFTIERYIAVKYPMKGKVWCTEARAKMLIICVFALGILFASPVPFEWKVIEKKMVDRRPPSAPIAPPAPLAPSIGGVGGATSSQLPVGLQLSQPQTQIHSKPANSPSHLGNSANVNSNLYPTPPPNEQISTSNSTSLCGSTSRRRQNQTLASLWPPEFGANSSGAPAATLNHDDDDDDDDYQPESGAGDDDDDDNGAESTMTMLTLDYSDFGRNETYKTFYYCSIAVIFYFIPLFSLMLFNGFLIKSVHRSQRARTKMTGLTTAAAACASAATYVLPNSSAVSLSTATPLENVSASKVEERPENEPTGNGRCTPTPERKGFNGAGASVAAAGGGAPATATSSTRASSLEKDQNQKKITDNRIVSSLRDLYSSRRGTCYSVFTMCGLEHRPGASQAGRGLGGGGVARQQQRRGVAKDSRSSSFSSLSVSAPIPRHLAAQFDTGARDACIQVDHQANSRTCRGSSSLIKADLGDASTRPNSKQPGKRRSVACAVNDELQRPTNASGALLTLAADQRTTTTGAKEQQPSPQGRPPSNLTVCDNNKSREMGPLLPAMNEKPAQMEIKSDFLANCQQEEDEASQVNPLNNIGSVAPNRLTPGTCSFSFSSYESSESYLRPKSDRNSSLLTVTPQSTASTVGPRLSNETRDGAGGPLQSALSSSSATIATMMTSSAAHQRPAITKSAISVNSAALAATSATAAAAAHSSAATSSSSTQERRITIMLIAVVILFLVCQIPSATMLLYTSVHNIPPNTNEQALEQAFGNIFNFLMAVNAAGNFILYSFLSKRYRRTFVILFCNCLSSGRRRTTSAAAATSTNNTNINNIKRNNQTSQSTTSQQPGRKQSDKARSHHETTCQTHNSAYICPQATRLVQDKNTQV